MSNTKDSKNPITVTEVGEKAHDFRREDESPGSNGSVPSFLLGNIFLNGFTRYIHGSGHKITPSPHRSHFKQVWEFLSQHSG